MRAKKHTHIAKLTFRLLINDVNVQNLFNVPKCVVRTFVTVIDLRLFLNFSMHNETLKCS